MQHKGTYDRGYLPHRDYPNSLQAITFRLADSVPSGVIAKWKQELEEEPSEHATVELHRRISRHEDAGHGSCILQNHAAAEIIQQTLIGGHPERYRLIAWCIMPNHVHVLVRLGEKSVLSEIVQGWKGGSSIRINRMRGASGNLWGNDFYDRYIRDEDHFHRAVHYIHQNPVKAGLCDQTENWPFSSAGVDWKPDQETELGP